LLAALALSVADWALFTEVVALALADVAEPAAADADCDAEEAFAALSVEEFAAAVAELAAAFA
jgi:hypothetical protein